MSRQARKRRLIRQRIIGIVILAACILVICACINGKTPTDHDGTALLTMIPSGLSLLFSRTVIID